MKHLVFVMLLGVAVQTIAQTPVIAVDSSLTAPMREIQREFEEHTGLRLELTFGASDRIARQIVQGFSYELFISASVEQNELLFRRGVSATSGWEFANSRVSIFVPEHSDLYQDADLHKVMSALRFRSYRKLAMPDPDHLPYGNAALQVLQSAGIWAIEHNRTLLAGEIGMLTQLAVSDLVDLALVPAAFLQLGLLTDKGVYLAVPEGWYQPVTYYVVLPAYASTAAREFERYLAGDRVRLILEQHGYATPELQ